MLRVNSGSRVAADSDFNGLQIVSNLLAVVRRRKWLIAAIAASIAGLSAFYALSATPLFIAEGQLLIDTQQSRSLDLGDGGGVSISADAGMIDSQVEILKSERIIKAVIKELKLVEAMKDRLAAQAANDKVPGFLKAIFPFWFQQAQLSDFELERRVIDGLKANIKVQRVGASFAILLSHKSPDGQRSADIVNQQAESYIVDQLESKYQATRRASVWLQDRIAELREQALAADRAVQDFKARNDIVDTGRGLVSDQQLSEVNTQLIQARAQVAESRARFERVQSIIKQGSALGASDEAVSDVLSNEIITRLRGQYLDAVKRAAEWTKRYGEDHVAVVNLRSEISGLQRAIFTELNRIAESYKSDFQIAKAREDSLSQSLKQLVAENKLSANKQVELRELESTAQSYRTLYDNFLERFMQTTQRLSFPMTEARMITSASRPLTPAEPKVGLIVAGGTVFGLALGLLAAFWRESMNRTIRSPAEVEQHLGLDCLGVLPKLAVSATASSAPSAASGNRTSAFESATGILRQVLTDPFSRYTETLRAVKVSADISILGRAKVIGITSTLPKEGKSTIAANFAQLIAHSGARALLVDMDLRNPSLTRRITPNVKSGLLELIVGRATMDEVSHLDPITGLRFVPSLVAGHIVHTNEILASAEMAATIEKFKEDADYVILDLPPVAPVVDVQACAHLVDCFVYVLEWGRTNRDLVGNILDNNPKMSEKVLGCLLNKADLAALRSLENYGGKYYYYQYHSRYGADT
ncbi:Wzz/FepE/Etk N-terminal domain-containing protein [Xanthobacter tagetidis]|uniref:non-specific protein-tyrosine kinase n=1 Tax=Xanthobacter tagetidis TaxID=60216 RepID=A0A3L7AJ49_9HYPH|nr:Wzz/FepE/Etk N-terminal domain-containing protein [Xanthobacter tagetidis]MBB6308957.1 succinoglycan biosynthesis transport protein ExoP [Xanthobacter tagetidis]RLP80536.1 exopolysaccharide biosynthesis protein [Xanthobacter tagetidis]